MDIKTFEYLNQSFIKEIENLEDDKFKLYYLLYHSVAIASGNEDYYDAWIIRENESWCVGLRVNGYYFIYGNIITKKISDKVKEVLNEVEFLEGFHFAGTSKFIDILDFNISSYKVRNFYKLLKKEFNPIIITNFNFRKSTLEDIKVIANLNSKYNREEWKGYNDRTPEEFEKLPSFVESVKCGDYFILEKEGRIIGFCSIMKFYSHLPNMIGTLYIDDDCRNNKFGQNLLNSVCNELLKKVDNLYLMTDSNNLESNKVVSKNGFKRIYSYSDVIFKSY